MHAGLLRLATRVAVAVAGLLILAKLTAWFLTDSVAILSSLMDSVLDVGASLVNMYAVAHSLVPADREHRFGHGKAEALAGLAQSAFISGSALFLLAEAGHRLIEPRVVARDEIGIAVMVLSICLTIGLVTFQRYVVKRTKSIAISADSMHYRADLLANLGVILALVLAGNLGWTYADPIIAVMIAVYILFGAWGIIKSSLDQLMDRELPEEQRAHIRAIALSHDEVEDVHDMRTRSSGVQTFIQLHLELDGELPLLRAHEIADQVEAEIQGAFPGAEVIIHQDPAGLEEWQPDFAR
ncbi:MAG: cation diffusion facilitator family transporter [Rhodospirillaceae bacterium]|nr:cation diffusion facilitator family transporter [Rhodospirillaceae bacterium]MBT4485960.1 cation diffusion facilitator family transporter [Rhodospirillaceae bacterium]MBT5898102.1 cation diffusion facilitator family transporter [Rhodospirillaceae bacterium]